MYKDNWKCGLVLALLTAGCGPTGEQDESVEGQRSYLTISPNAVYQIKSAATGKCIGIAGNSAANNAAAEVRTCDGSAGQNFTLASVAGGYYAIKNSNSLKCLDVTGKSTADGAVIIQYTCSASATNQQWAIADTSGGMVRLTSRNSNKVMEVSLGATADGTAVVQRKWNGATYQQFQLSTGSVDVASVVPDLDGFYWEATCSGDIAVHGKNCPFLPTGSTSTTCPTGTTWATRGAIRDTTLNVKGTPGTPYTVNFEVRGVVGTRCYSGGTAAYTGVPSVDGPNNTWYVGGVQANNSIWSTYELHVSPPVPGEANVYFFNAFPSNPSWCEKEATYQVGYTASFKVLGGGTMKFTIHDANCMTQQNCGGNDSATTCDAPRTIDLSGMSPAASFGQPPVSSVSGSTYYPQWLYFDVKSVTSP
jgi:hypothetical protein